MAETWAEYKKRKQQERMPAPAAGTGSTQTWAEYRAARQAFLAGATPQTITGPNLELDTQLRKAGDSGKRMDVNTMRTGTESPVRTNVSGYDKPAAEFVAPRRERNDYETDDDIARRAAQYLKEAQDARSKRGNSALRVSGERIGAQEDERRRELGPSFRIGGERTGDARVWAENPQTTARARGGSLVPDTMTGPLRQGDTYAPTREETASPFADLTQAGIGDYMRQREQAADQARRSTQTGYTTPEGEANANRLSSLYQKPGEEEVFGPQPYSWGEEWMREMEQQAAEEFAPRYEKARVSENADVYESRARGREKRWEQIAERIRSGDEDTLQLAQDGMTLKGNEITYARTPVEEQGDMTGLQFATAVQNQTGFARDSHLLFVTDEQYQVYSYLLAQDEQYHTDEAKEYLKSIREEIDARAAMQNVEDMEKLPPVLKEIVQAANAAYGGIDQTVQGNMSAVMSLLNSRETLPVSYQQQVVALMNRNLDEQSGWKIFGKGWKAAASELITTTTAQLPQIMTGQMAAELGLTFAGAQKLATLGPMAVSVYGNTYAQGIRDGYTPEQARNLGLVSAAIETATEVIGGVGFVSGGTLTEEAVSKWVGSIDNAFARYAANLASDALGEGVEEAVSGVLSPIAEAYVLLESLPASERIKRGWNDIDWEEVLYDAMMGAASGLAMGGTTLPAQIAEDTQLREYARNAGKEGYTFREFMNDANAKEIEVNGWMRNEFERGKAERRGGMIEEAAAEGSTLGEIQDTMGEQLTDEDIASFNRGLEKFRAEWRVQQNLEEAATGTTEEAEQERAQEQSEAEARETETATAYEQQEDRQAQAEEAARKGRSIETLEEQAPLSDEERAAFEQAQSETEIPQRAQPQEEQPREQQEEPREAQPAKEMNVVREAAAIARDTLKSDTATHEEKVATTAEGLRVAGVKNAEERANAIVAMHEGGQLTAEQEADLAGDDTVMEFVHEALTSESAYNYGRAGMSVENVEEITGGEMTDEARAEYERGQAERREAARQRARQAKEGARDQRAQRGVTAITEEEATQAGVRTIDPKKLSTKQKAARGALEILSRATGVNFVLYESETDDLGEHAGRNGWWNYNTSTAYIDISSGEAGEEAMLRTTAHELTHFIKEWSAEKYEGLRDFLVGFYNGKGADVLPRLVADEIDLAERRGHTMSEDEAMDEVTANAFQMMLSDPDAIAGLAKKDVPLFVRMKMHIDSFIAKIRKAITGVGANEEAAKILGQDMQTLRRAQEMWYEALSDASDTLRSRIIEETQAQVEEIRAGGEKTGTDFVLVPGTDFVLVDYERMRANQKRAFQKPTGLAVRQMNALSVIENTQTTKATEAEPVLEAEAAAETETAMETEPAAETQAEAEEPESGKKEKSLKSVRKTLANRLLQQSQRMYPSRSSAHYQATDPQGRQVVINPYRSIRLNQEQAIRLKERPSNIEDLPWDWLEKFFDTTNSTEVNLPGADEVNSLVEKHKEAAHNGNGYDVVYDFGTGMPAVNPAYLQEAMQAFPDAKTAWVQNNPRTPVVIRGADGDMVIMPLVNSSKATEKAAPATSTQAQATRATSAAFRKLLQHWAENEWVNQPLDGSERAERFTEFAEKWYNAGRDGLRATQVDQAGEEGFPPFLQDTFYRQGEKEAQAAQKRRNARAGKKTATKGEVTNGEGVETGVHHAEAVREPGADGEGTVRVLDEVPPEVLPGNGGEGQAVGSDEERGSEAGRDAAGRGGERAAGVGSDRVPETGDVRDAAGGGRGGRGRGADRVGRLPGIRNEDARGAEPDTVHGGRGGVEEGEPLTPEEAVEAAHDQREAPAQNYHFDTLELPRGEKARYQANVEAIRTMKQILAEGRQATPAEQEILSKYVGWGALANAFDETKPQWKKEYAELKGLLTDEEYSAARGSTLNAHYTDISVVKAMYEALRNWGFKGGRMLEPSAGSGNFLGAMPADMARKVTSWRAVELDKVTGNILSLLYPQAKVDIMGFEQAKMPNDFFDVAIGNVPFGNFGVTDDTYNKNLTGQIHDYFFVKTMDKVRPGGIVFYITSAGTMDKRSNTVRDYLATKADFMGAVRLPSDAFQGNAGTQVVTDILVFKKRAEGQKPGGQQFRWAHTLYIDEDYRRSVQINEYFHEHPEMILGTLSDDGTMYGDKKEMTVHSNGKPLGPQIVEALGKIPMQIQYDRDIKTDHRQEARQSRETTKAKPNGYVLENGDVFQNVDGELRRIDMKEADKKRLQGLLNLRDVGRAVIEAQRLGKTDAEIKKLQKQLGTAYDAFVREFGYIHTKQNQAVLAGDPDRQFVSALENYTKEGKTITASKADIFSKRVYTRVSRPTAASNRGEAIAISMNENAGHLDVARVAQLMGQSEKTVRDAMLEEREAFLDEDGALVSRAEYLSGYVRAKLKNARALAETDERYRANVEELEKVVPTDKTQDQIAIHMGETWIPAEVYEQYINENLQIGSWRSPGEHLSIDMATGHWTFDVSNGDIKDYTSSRKNSDLGAAGQSFLDIVQANMNGKQIIIKEDVDGKKVVNAEKTTLVQERQEAVREDFRKWLFQDEKRTSSLLGLYNDTYRSYVAREYDGESFTVDGLSPETQLRDYQKRAAQRIVQQGSGTLLAHCVGAGKTATMAAAAMKMRELGTVRKPLFVVPKPVVEQWGNEFLKFFPGARILVAQNSDFAQNNRREFVSRVATNEYDAVIMSYEQFQKIPMSAERERAFLEQLKQEALEAKQAEDGGKDRGRSKRNNRRTVKQTEKFLKQLEKRINELAKVKRDADNMYFEDLGVDGLFVDEAHNFKNVTYFSNMQVSGMGNPNGAKKSTDLMQKCRYLQELNGGRGLVFATATPVMNSMVEMYAMQRYLQPDTMKRFGVDKFDNWARMFGKVTSEIMPTPSGNGFRVEQIFSRFQNMAELQRMFRANADVMTKLPSTVKLPKVRGGKHIIVECEMTDFQRAYIKHLGERADKLQHKGGGAQAERSPLLYNVYAQEADRFQKENSDNMLVICSDGRKMALSQKLIDPSLDWGNGSKIYRCADYVLEEYKNDQDNLGTQLIFCDLSVPGSGTTQNTDEETAEAGTDDQPEEASDVYNEIKRALIERGIPAGEIAFIHDFNTPEKKEALSKAMADGTIRVLIGSTVKVGTGMNIQKRIVAMHHLDCPWRPGDLQQRDGRGIRFGNIHDEVAIYNYVTVGTFDTRMWAKVENKSQFINEVTNGNEETDEVPGDDFGMSAAEIKAVASGNPILLEQAALERDIEKLKALKRAYAEEQEERAYKRRDYERSLAWYDKALPGVREDAEKAKQADVSGDKFAITINGKTVTKREDAGKAVIKAAQKAYVPSATKTRETAKADRRITIGELAGFKVFVDTQLHAGIEGNELYSASVNEDSAMGTMRTLENRLLMPTAQAQAYEQQAQAAREWLESNKIDPQFDRQMELDQKLARMAEIELELGDKTNFVEAEATENTSASERRDTPSDRRLLVQVMEQLTETEIERAGLARYKGQIERLERNTERLHDVNAEIRELSFKKGTRTAEERDRLGKLRVEKERLANTIAGQDRILSRIQRSDAIINLLNVERKKAMQQERARQNERYDNYKARAESELAQEKAKHKADVQKTREKTRANELKKKISEEAGRMRDMLKRPTEKAHIPQILHTPVLNLLEAIDFSSPRLLKGKSPTKADLRLAQAMENLRDIMEQEMAGRDGDDVSGNVDLLYGQYLDIPEDMLNDLKEITKTVRRQTDYALSEGGFTINDMTVEQLEQLERTLRLIFHGIHAVDNTMVRATYASVQQMSTDSIWDENELGSRAKVSKAADLLMFTHGTPYHVMKRLGRGGQAVFDGFRMGMKRMADNFTEIESFINSNLKQEEVLAWRNDLKTIELEDGTTVQLTSAHIMEMYAHMKRDQAVGHYKGAGFRIANFTKGNNTTQDAGHTTSIQEIQKIIAENLTDRQREIVDKFQTFAGETGGEWGNYVSVRRFGEEMYKEGKTYWPIEVDRGYLNSDPEQKQSGGLYRLLNMGFTKALTPNANNRIMVNDFFETFAQHMSDMAQYNAFALPVLDAVKWINYREKVRLPGDDAIHVQSVKNSIRNAHGDAAVHYVLQLIKDISGANFTGNEDKSMMALLRLRNRGAVAANLRVAALQPTSIARALDVLNIREISGGVKNWNALRWKRIAEEMEEHSGAARWKKLGFYDSNVGRSVNEMFGVERSKAHALMDKALEKASMLTEAADRITWSYIWAACKTKIDATQKNLEKGSEEYWHEVTRLFEDVIYRTQVFDSVLTRSQFMRSTGSMNKIFGSFMMEGVVSYNMLMDSVTQYQDDARRLGSKKAAFAKNRGRMLRALKAYAATSVLSALVESLFEAWRDDDDYKTFWEKYIEKLPGNIIENLLPFHLVPVISQGWDSVKTVMAEIPQVKEALAKVGWDIYGYDSLTPLGELIQQLQKTADVTRKFAASKGGGKGYTVYGLIYQFARSGQTFSGIPVANLMRDGISLWNNAFAPFFPKLRVESYMTQDSVAGDLYVKAYIAGDEDRMGQLTRLMGYNDADLPKTVTAAAKRAWQDGKLDEDAAKKLLIDIGTGESDAALAVYKWGVQDEFGGSATYSRVYDYIENYDGPALKKEIDTILATCANADEKKKKKSAIAGAITSRFKPIYKEASTAERAQMQQHLRAVYGFLGVKVPDFTKWTQ